MTYQEALDITKKIFDSAVKSGMFSTIEDAAAVNETFLTLSKKVNVLDTQTKNETK